MQHQELIQRIEEAERIGISGAVLLDDDHEPDESEQLAYQFASLSLGLLRECKAALSSPSPAPAPLPEGMVLAPMEPTREMVEQGYSALMEWDARTGEDHGITEVWLAMLAASPGVQDQPVLSHVATIRPSDPLDERDTTGLFYLSASDSKRIAALGPGAKLYAEVQDQGSDDKGER